MPLPTSGPLSIANIKNEFTPSASYPNGTFLDNFYRGGGFVPDTAANINIPTSGPIAILDFYGGDNSPASYIHLVQYDSRFASSACSGTSTTVYQTTDPFDVNTEIYSDSGLTTFAPTGFYAYPDPFSGQTLTRYWDSSGYWSGDVDFCEGEGFAF